MSKKVYAALDEDFIRRMRNWVKAKDGVPIGNCGVEYIDDRYREAKMPLLFGEALDTEAALRLVPLRYQMAVRQFWTWEGRSLRDHGRRRRVHYEAFERWVIKGHELLKVEIWKRSAAWRQHSEALRARAAGA